jgi:hypothetical protein
MKLLVNGCSFTGGNDVIHDENGILTETPDYVWSNHTGVDTTNIAIAGNSNDKIIRTTLEHLSNNDDYDGVIIQWTALYRLERYIEQYNIWGNLCNTANVLPKEETVVTIYEETVPSSIAKMTDENLYGIHFDKNEEDHDDKVNTLDKLLKSASNNYIWLNSEVDYRVKFLQDIIVMQNTLEKMDMPYLFTSMSLHNHFKHLKCMTDYEHVLSKQVNKSKWTKRPLTHICATDFDESQHPNKTAHKRIASELIREFKRVNG